MRAVVAYSTGTVRGHRRSTGLAAQTAYPLAIVAIFDNFHRCKLLLRPRFGQYQLLAHNYAAAGEGTQHGHQNLLGVALRLG